MLNDKGHFFYSRKQEKQYRRSAENEGKTHLPTYCMLENGDIREYTEWCHTNKPSGEWDDYVYLGEGKYLRRG